MPVTPLPELQVFYVETVNGVRTLQNRGFFDGGRGIIADPGFPNNIGQYRFGPILQGPLDTQQLQSIRGFQPKDYSLMRNNCQDYCSEVRQQFGQ